MALCFLCIFGLILIFERCLQFFSYCLRGAILVAAGDLGRERLLPAVILWFCRLLPQLFGHGSSGRGWFTHLDLVNTSQHDCLFPDF